MPFRSRSYAKKPTKAGLAFAEQACKPRAKPAGDRHTGDLTDEEAAKMMDWLKDGDDE